MAVEAGSVNFQQSARVIVFKDNQMLVMNRNKFGKMYRTLVGGGVEPGETPDKAAIRETLEESSIVIRKPKKIFTETVPEYNVVQHIYICEYVSGEPSLHPESEESESNLAGGNLYTPAWIKLDEIFKELDGLPFVTRRLLDEINFAFERDFRISPKEWTA